MPSNNPRGGPARPGAVKRLEGERRQRINDQEPVPEQAGPRDFEHFNDEQRALYAKVIADLEVMGLAYLSDEARLVAYVYAEWMQLDCIRRINETGLLVRGANGEPKANPLIAVRDRADSRATVLAREFGLTPSSRQSIRKEPAVPEIERTEATRRRGKGKAATTGGSVSSLFG